MTQLPMHIQEGQAGPWLRWFAWYPVRSEQDFWIWLRYTCRRWSYPPVWFCPPAPWRWCEYSDERKNWWGV